MSKYVCYIYSIFEYTFFFTTSIFELEVSILVWPDRPTRLARRVRLDPIFLSFYDTLTFFFVK